MDDSVDGGTGRGARLQSSARGWLSLQLAVLGFVGLCGVLKGGGETSAPRGVEAVAGVLVLLALLVACVATWLVGRTAWPVLGLGGAGADPEAPAEVARAARRLRAGLVLTFVAVALMAAAATAGWWPQKEGAAGSKGLVEVTTSAGTLCGELRWPEVAGAVRLRVSGGQAVDISLSEVSTVAPVERCA
ncbi:hypothetical protein ACFV9D_12945 [Streptomyces sp. NPDC059875]|uniref:hypothetical protein n=1 Tax=unclassified Streptomyces TaxID=2593676 RepID=UPI0036655033